MLFSRSAALEGLEVVVLDEVHYLQDPYRGSVWEEVLVLTPPAVRLRQPVGHGQQRSRLRGVAHLHPGHHPGHRGGPPTGHPPPPLRPRPAPPGRASPCIPLLRGSRPNPEGLALDERRRRHRHHRYRAPRRVEVVEYLAGAGMLPAITFIFSRAACDDATRQCLRDGDPVDHRRGTGPDPPGDRGRRGAARTTTTSAPWATARGRRRWRRASPRTTPGWCRPSARRWSSASPTASSRWSSPPRRWPSASTCRPAPWWSNGSPSSAGRTPRRSPPGSTAS